MVSTPLQATKLMAMNTSFRAEFSSTLSRPALSVNQHLHQAKKLSHTIVHVVTFGLFIEVIKVHRPGLAVAWPGKAAVVALW